MIYRLSGRRIFSYPEERPGFELPEKYKQEKDKPSRFGREDAQEEGERRASDSAETVVGESQSRSDENDQDKNKNKTKKDGEKKDGDDKEGKDDTITVDWYSEDDPENPQNWYVSFDTSFLSFPTLSFPSTHSLDLA